MKIYVGFSCPTGSFEPFAWLIKWIEDRPYDHCYVRFQEPTGAWMIFQASKEMVNLYAVPVWLQYNQSIKEYEINITDAQNSALWGYIKTNLGIPYSLLEDFGILLMKIFKLQNNPYAGGFSAEFCSKSAANVCNVLGIQMPESTDDIDPSALDSILAGLNLQLVNNPDITQ